MAPTAPPAVTMLGAREARSALRRATAAYVLGTMAHITFIFYLAPIALRSADILGRDAWVFSGTAVAMMLTVLPAGWLADRFPRRFVLGGGLVLLAASYAPLVLPVSFAGVLAATVLTGTGLALLFVSFNAYVADLLARTETGAAYGNAGAMAILASASGPFVAALVFRVASDEALALRIAAVIFGLVTLAGALLTVTLPRARLAPADAPGAASPVVGWRGDARTVAPVALLYVLMGAGYGMTLPYFAVFFLDHVRLDAGAWGLVLAAATVASALGSLLAGRLGRERPLTIAVGTQALHAGIACAFLFPLAAPLLGAAYIGRHFVSTGVAPVINALLMARVRAEARARAQGFVSLAWNAGWATGAVAGGVLLANVGGAVFALGAGLALAGVSAGAWLLRERA